MGSLICIIAFGFNVALYAADTERWWNAGSAAVCFCCFLVCAMHEVRRGRGF